MTPAQENELFDYLWKVPRFKEWFQARLDTQLQALISSSEIDHLRRAQGQAQAYKAVLDKLEAAEKTARSR